MKINFKVRFKFANSLDSYLRSKYRSEMKQGRQLNTAMKTQFHILAFIAVIIALFNTSCVITTGSDITWDQLSKMPPFKATVVRIDVDHSFIFGDDDVMIVLRKADGGYLLYWHVISAKKVLVDFARSLHEGQSYTFPQVCVDYFIKSQSTNALTK